MSFILTSGDYRLIGYSDKSSLLAKYTFPADYPWIGLYGSYTANVHSLGAVAF